MSGSSGEEEAEDEYVVEAICGSRTRNGVRQFEIKWEGFPSSDNTWEPEENLSHSADKLADFKAAEAAKKEAKKKPKKKPAVKLDAVDRAALRAAEEAMKQAEEEEEEEEEEEDAVKCRLLGSSDAWVKFCSARAMARAKSITTKCVIRAANGQNVAAGGGQGWSSRTAVRWQVRWTSSPANGAQACSRQKPAHRKSGKTSRFRGVWLQGSRWYTQSGSKHLGAFEDEADAARVWDDERRATFGKYAHCALKFGGHPRLLNFPTPVEENFRQLPVEVQKKQQKRKK
eukprot:COSAG01_NODE_8667_length_2703_cov_43.714670_1_plen_285_part_10